MVERLHCGLNVGTITYCIAAVIVEIEARGAAKRSVLTFGYIVIKTCADTDIRLKEVGEPDINFIIKEAVKSLECGCNLDAKLLFNSCKFLCSIFKSCFLCSLGKNELILSNDAVCFKFKENLVKPFALYVLDRLSKACV